MSQTQPVNTNAVFTSESESLSNLGQSAPSRYFSFSNLRLSSPTYLNDVAIPVSCCDQSSRSPGFARSNAYLADVPFQNPSSLHQSTENSACGCFANLNLSWPKENENISSAAATEILNNFYLGSPLYYASGQKPKVFKPVLLYHKDADKSKSRNPSPYSLKSRTLSSPNTKLDLGFESPGTNKLLTPSQTSESDSPKSPETFVDLNIKNRMNVNHHISAFRRPTSKSSMSCEPTANVHSHHSPCYHADRDAHQVDSLFFQKNFSSLEKLATLRDYVSHLKSQEYLVNGFSKYDVQNLYLLEKLKTGLLPSHVHGHDLDTPGRDRSTEIGLGSSISNSHQFCYRNQQLLHDNICSIGCDSSLFYRSSTSHVHSFLGNPHAVPSQQPRLDRPKEVAPERFMCHVCNTTCNTSSKLKNHLKVHSGERPHKCECGRTFARNEELTRHQRIHSGHRPHRCQLCGKTFGRKDHLNKHRTTHLQTSEKKVHACDIPGCFQRYTRSDALARHQWSAHGIKAKTSKWRPESNQD